MRTLLKSWSDKKPFSRRAQWFESADSIRLCFEDGEARINLFYNDRKKAQADYDRFRNGVTALTLEYEREMFEHQGPEF